jgi:hypothetical protein
MYDVNQISSDPKQSQILYLPDGTAISVSFEYMPQQYGWFLNLVYGNFVLNGVRITTSPNMLHQYRNLIPFGLCVSMVNNLEPTNQQDFSSGNAQMFILSSDEVTQYEVYLNG